MKQPPLLLVTIFLLPTVFLLAQPSFPSYEDAPRWNLLRSGLAGQTRSSIELKSDTLLCGLPWNQVVENVEGEAGPHTLGYIHRDGQRVYYRRSADCGEPARLMYDFSLEAGDSLYLAFFNPGVNEFDADTILTHVLATDSVEINGVTRKRLTIRFDFPYDGFPVPTFYATHWIEGIGDLTHPFHPAVCLFHNFCENLYNLLCLTQEEQVVFINSTIPAETPCGELTGSRAPQKASIEVAIFPNPARFFLNIKYQNLPPDSNWQLFDNLGVEVATLPLSGSEGLKQLATDHLPPGNYFWLLLTPNSRLRSGRLQIVR